MLSTDEAIPADDAYQRPTNDNPITQGIHGPHAERFEPKEEGWLLGNGNIRPLIITSGTADGSHGDSGAREGSSVSHVKPGSSLTGEAPIDSNRPKCYYCIASETHAPHLHNVQLCTCAFRSANGTLYTSTESVTALNATSSAPRFDPAQLLRRSTYSSDDLVPVNGPDLSVAGLAVRRARRNQMDLLPLSRFSMAGTGATTYIRPRSLPSWYTSGPSQGAANSITDDPKGKRPASTNDERSLTTTRGIPPFTSRSRRSPSVPPSPLYPSTAEYESYSNSESDDEVTVADDADDDQSSHTTGPSTSEGTQEASHKRRRHNSTVNDVTHPHAATTRRIHQRRRLERSRQRAGSAPHTLAQRACCAYILTRTTNNSLRAVPEPHLPHGNAIETLEQSHQRVREYIASCFASNQRLRIELAEAREENERLVERLTRAERDAFRY